MALITVPTQRASGKDLPKSVEIFCEEESWSPFAGNLSEVATHSVAISGRTFQVSEVANRVADSDVCPRRRLVEFVFGLTMDPDLDIVAEQLVLELETFRLITERKFTGECFVALRQEWRASKDSESLFAWSLVDDSNLRLLRSPEGDWEYFTRHAPYDFRAIAVTGQDRLSFRIAGMEEIVQCDNWIGPVEDTYNGRLVIPSERLSHDTWRVSFLRKESQFKKHTVDNEVIECFRQEDDANGERILYVATLNGVHSWSCELIESDHGAAIFFLRQVDTERAIYVQGSFPNYQNVGIAGLNFLTVAIADHSSTMSTQDVREAFRLKVEVDAATHYPGGIFLCEPVADSNSTDGLQSVNSQPVSEGLKSDLLSPRVLIAVFGLILLFAAALLKRRTAKA